MVLLEKTAMGYTINFLLPILLSTFAIEATDTGENDTMLEDLRHPRVSGRIVKLYSGSKPEPFLCPDEGFQPDQTNCAVFYRCVRASNGRYTVFRFQCGPGTIYDPDTNICNHPRSTKRSECGGILAISPFPGHNNENEIDGAPSELPSPISTKLPVYTQRTTAKESTTSSTVYPWATSSKQTSSQSYITTSYPWMTPATQQKTTPTKVNHQSSSHDGEACIHDGFMGDSENCRKFYRCVGNQRGGFIRYEFSCSESTIWDEDTQSCNHPWAVQRRRCGRGNSDSKNLSTSGASLPKNKEKPTIQQQTQISFGSELSQSQIQIAQEPVNQNQVQISFGDRLNEKENFGGTKQDQTQINFGSAVSQTQTQINIGNKGVQTQVQIDHTKSSSQTQTQVYKTTTAKPATSVLQEHDNPGYGIQSNTEGSTNNEDNENICTESGFMGDKNDCKKFYRCVDNGKGTYTIYEFSCGEGTVWDSSLEACNHAWAVKECGGKAPATAQTTPPETTTIKSTQSYYTTSHSTTVEESEDIPYGNQNQESQKTSTTTSTTTSQMPMTTGASISNHSICYSSGFMGDVKDCKKFYRCVDNGGGSYTKYEFSCGEGTVWDSKIEACNHPWAVEKCGGSLSDINKVESTTTMKTTVITSVSLIHTTTQALAQNNDYETGYGQQNSESPLTTSTKNPQNHQEYEDNKCQSSGFMGDKNDCKKFYRCVDSGNGAYIRYEFSCGEGTVWDPQIEACNHAWAVEKCGGGDNTGDVQKETTPRPTQTLSDEELNTGYTTENQKETERTSDNSIASSTSTSATGTTNINNSECKTSGFIGDKNDCKKFYRCVDNGKGSFTRYEFSCGEGTVWDQSIEACNHAWMVENCGRTENSSANAHIENTTPYYSTTTEIEDYDPGYGSSSSEKTSTTALTESSNESSGDVCSKEGFFGDRKDCKKFYRCVDNGRGGFIKYEFTCGEGTVWDSEINACNHPTPDRKCGVIGTENTSQTPVHESDETFTEITAATSTSTEQIQSAVTPQKPLPSDATCKSEGFYGNPKNCKKFYRCVDNGNGGYTKYDFDCGDGTVWDPEIQSCNHESSHTNCTKSSGSDSNETHSESSEKEPTTTVSSTDAVQISQKPENSEASLSTCSSDGFYANPNDCTKFFRCVNNGKRGFTKYDFTCGEGTIWVQDIQACDHDNDNSTCSKQSGSTSSTTQTFGEQHYTTELISTTYSDSSDQGPNKENDEIPSDSSSGSPAVQSDRTQCNSEGFYSNEDDCRRFYRCVDNGKGGYTRYDFTCGEGTAWDSDIQACNHISEVNSCKNSNQQESSTKPVMHDEDMSQTTTSAPTDSSTKPSISDASTENGKPTNKDICEQEGYFGNTEDCKKFYRCVDNGKGGLTKYDYTCGDGTIWDQDIITCNHPQDVTNPSCQQKYNSETSTSSTTSSSTSSSGSQSTTTTTESSTNSSNCSEENSSTKPNNKVNCSKAGYFADPNDCKKFYRCVDWDGDGKRFSVYHFDCGEGTIWDPSLDTCNHEESVYPPRDCSGTQSQNENVGQDSTTTEQAKTEEPTTQQSTTTDQTTTQESTTSEPVTTQQTTTQESTTTESTTALQTTSEQTTTQQTTSQQTDEQITTQQTTGEQTTTQQTTGEQTTNQQTTSEQTTTQQTVSQETTTQQTTTEQSITQITEESTTAQQTSTQETTTQQTTEQTTTQQSTVSETMTTQQSTNSEQTTNEQSTSSDQMTTQQTSTESGQTTTTIDNQQNTTEQTTTQESSTEQQTNETTDESTSTTDESSTTEDSTTESQQETTETSSSDNDCPDTDDDQNVFVCPTSFRRHPKYCNLFYQCTEDDDNHDVKVAVFHCPNNTIYDENSTKCVEEEKADKKCKGDIAERRRVKRLDTKYKEPITVTKERLKCPAVGHFPFESEECSSAFLKCQKAKSGKIRGFVYQCPEGFVYWSVSRRCEAKSYMRHCKHSYNDWNGRWEIPIERRNVAP